MASADDQPSDLELMETLDEVRASADYAIYQVVEEDAAVSEAKELAGEVPF